MPEHTSAAVAPVGDTEVELLTSVPRIGPLIARSTLTALGRPGAQGSLPTRRVVVTGVEVDAGALADYSRVCGLTLRGQLPTTYLHVLTFPLHMHLMAGRDFPFRMAGMVHIANEMTLHRPVDLGEHLTLSVSVADLRPHHRGVTVDLLGRVEVGSETVWQGRSTYLAKEAATGGPSGAAPPRSAGDLDDLPWWATWQLGADLGRRYAAVAGDVNPIHLNPLAARAFGFPRTIAHGMWTHARVLGALEGRLPDRHTVWVQFRKPVLLPSRVDLHARPSEGGAAFAVTSRGGTTEHLVGGVQGADSPS